jgi:threonyl-tRNA synthetase
MEITVTLPDGNGMALEAGKTPADVAKKISKGLYRASVAARVDGELVDLNRALDKDCQLALVTNDTPEGLDVLRHSTAHLMAQAVQKIFEGTKVAIGPSIEDGFYYDFDLEHRFHPEDLKAIEKEMARIVKRNLPIERLELSRAEALKLFGDMNEQYKVELIGELSEDAQITAYRQGDFVDLCRGPHVSSTGKLKVYKLLSIAGAYWRGSEDNAMLQRIYGTAFATREELDKRLEALEEAKRRDHRKLGRELDLFSIEDEVGPGFVIWHPKGALVRTILEEWERKEHLRRGYDIVMGPQILRKELWEKSGHYDNYRENMYFTDVEGQHYGIKPMNCLAHMMVYKSKIRSYRDLPLRYFELGTVHRHEKSGVLHGLTRVRGFTQDDAHILCTPEQLQDEITAIIKFVKDVMGVFDFPFEVELSTRPEKSIGEAATWDEATTALQEALAANAIEYKTCEGEGAFYGPKIDFKLKDSLDRRWQCATIQADFVLPERFDLTYVGADGERHRPVMLHRVILGSIERFIGVLIEHYAGAFPTWLAPVQVVVLPITDRHLPYAREVEELMLASDVRVKVDSRNEKLGYKIRETRLQRVPYMIVVGDKEVEARTASVRTRDGEERQSMALETIVAEVAAQGALPRL